MDHLPQVHEPEVLVVPMRAYDLVLGLRWFKTHKPKIDWVTGRITSSRTPSGQGELHRSGIIVQWYEGRYDENTDIWLPGNRGSTPTINSTSEIPVDPDGKPTDCGEDSPTPDIEILGATAFDDLLASDQTIQTFALRIVECSGLLGATMVVTTLEDPGVIETINQTRCISKKTCPFGRNGFVRADALCQSHQRHPSGRLLRARPQYDASLCISPSDRGFAVSSRSVSIPL